jgi:5-methylcytosine-specific restriction endonuclease McrA
MPYRKFNRKTFSKAFRKKIFERDNYECQFCFKNLIDKEAERVIDHKIPLSKGGSNTIANLWLLCDDCDKRKKDDVYDYLANEYIKGRLRYLKNKKNNSNGENKGGGNISSNASYSQDK